MASWPVVFPTPEKGLEWTTMSMMIVPGWSCVDLAFSHRACERPAPLGNGPVPAGPVWTRRGPSGNSDGPGSPLETQGQLAMNAAEVEMLAEHRFAKALVVLCTYVRRYARVAPNLYVRMFVRTYARTYVITTLNCSNSTLNCPSATLNCPQSDVELPPVRR